MNLLSVSLTIGLFFFAVTSVESCRQSTLSAGGAGGQQFTCPLHPKVECAAIGNCPNCGMILVKRLLSNKASK